MYSFFFFFFLGRTLSASSQFDHSIPFFYLVFVLFFIPILRCDVPIFILLNSSTYFLVPLVVTRIESNQVTIIQVRTCTLCLPVTHLVSHIHSFLLIAVNMKYCDRVKLSKLNLHLKFTFWGHLSSKKYFL